MTRVAIIAIASAEAVPALEAAAAEPIEERFRLACVSTRACWLAPDEDEAFAAAIAALMQTATADEKTRITREVEALAFLERVLRGDLTVEGPLAPEDPIGLVGIFRETKP